MKRKLFSELRTIYETDETDPHTFRISIKLKDMIDADVLRRAVDTTMVRYPYFRVRACLDGEEVCFEDNPEPMPVIHTDKRIVLGSEQTSGHLLAFCYWKNWLYIDIFHGMTDGGGIAPLLKTLLYYYCSMYYEEDIPDDGIRLSDSEIPKDEWTDPAARPIENDEQVIVQKWNSDAFQLEGAGIVNIIPDSIIYNVKISEDEFMRFNLSNDGSPATIISLLLARTISMLHPDAEEPVVIAMCVNQRKALQAPLAHQSLVGDVRLVFNDKLHDMEFSTQATCFRGMVSIQSNEDMVLNEIQDYQSLMSYLEKLDTHAERRECCVNKMKSLSKCITATVSYVGKANMGYTERYIQEYEALPSTALPSTHVPLTIEMSALHGSFFINFIQFFEEDDYFNMFIKQLRENDINYDVLELSDAQYPRIELPV